MVQKTKKLFKKLKIGENLGVALFYKKNFQVQKTFPNMKKLSPGKGAKKNTGLQKKSGRVTP